METFEDFSARINEFEVPEFSIGTGCFKPSESVLAKVGKDGKFLPFFGDTSVFDLEASAKDRLDKIIEFLYKEAGECFGCRLSRENLHMTLHDLNASPDLSSISENMERSGTEFKRVFSKLKLEFSSVSMKAGFVFNMVNTSVVLGLYPADNEEYLKLCALYSAADSVKRLSYPMTPHITLGYYSRLGFGSASAQKLKQAAERLNQNIGDMSMVMHLNRLYYEHFSDMDCYKKIYAPFN